ncbi:MAG: ATP-binding protein [Lachnospiraceae bacterium]|nr:ATP-binding protein [Lachnospiraceae bacterium]
MVDFFIMYLNFLPYIPVEICCFLPVRSKIKGKSPRTAALIILFQFLVTVPAACALSSFGFLPDELVRVIIVIVFLIMYYRSVKVHIATSVGVSVFFLSVMQVLYNFSYAIEAQIHPDLGCDYYTVSLALIKLAFACAFFLIAAYPVKKYGSMLVERLLIPNIWASASIVPGILFAFNYILRLKNYSTLFVNRIYVAYVGVQVACLMLLILLTFFFYHIVSGMLREAETNEKVKILTLQERYYKAQQDYLNDTARARHDFKHAIHTLERLAANGNIEGIRSFLSEYSDNMPRTEVVYYCSNIAVNALLNYYAEQAKKAKIRFTLEVDMPAELPLSDVEMCAVIGNILENAVFACKDIPAEERFADLVIRVENDSQLYIVAANSFNGELEMNDGRLLSTHGGSGIGLASIASIVSRYGGMARFSSEDNEFFSDVVIPLKLSQISNSASEQDGSPG